MSDQTAATQATQVRHAPDSYKEALHEALYEESLDGLLVSLKAAESAVLGMRDRDLESLRREVAAARKFAADMRDFCSPHGVASDYADRLVEVMDRAKEGS